MRWVVALFLVSLTLLGCTPTGISAGDEQANRQKYSKEAYDDAMRKAGRGDELNQQEQQPRDDGRR